MYLTAVYFVKLSSLFQTLLTLNDTRNLHVKITNTTNNHTVPYSSYNDIPIRLLIVRSALTPKMLAILVNKMPLVPVHALERVRSALLLALFGQLHQLGQSVVDRLAESRIFLGPGTHVV